MAETNNDRLLTVSQVAEKLNMSKATVYSKTKMGEIPSVKFGETIRVKESDLENFEEFRIDYILKKISKDDLAKTVYRKDNLRRKYAQMLQVYEILSVVGIESFRNIHESSQTWARDLVDAEDVWSRTWGRAEVDAGGHETEGYQLYHKVSKDNREKLPELITSSIEEYKQLIEYCNKQFQKISVSYNQSVPQIVHRHNKWDWTTGNKFTLKNIK